MARHHWTNKKARVDINLVAGIEKPPKSAAGLRVVDLADEAIAALIAQKQHSFEAGQQIWLNPRAAEPWKTDAQLVFTTYGKFIREDYLRPKLQAGLRSVSV